MNVRLSFFFFIIIFLGVCDSHHFPTDFVKAGFERIHIQETIEKELDENLDFDAITNGDLECVSEKLGLGRL